MLARQPFTLADLTRGDRVTMDDTTGTYVGTDAAHVVWICWEADPEAYEQMCQAFDRLASTASGER